MEMFRSEAQGSVKQRHCSVGKGRALKSKGNEQNCNEWQRHDIEKFCHGSELQSGGKAQQ